MPEQPATPGARKPARSRTPSTRRRQPDQDEIATRGYFMYLAEAGDDELAELAGRAERELMMV